MPLYSSSATFTPAATSHTNGDVNGTAQEFTKIGDPGAYIRILTATLTINGGTLETTAWAVHLFSATPPSAWADDAALDIVAADRAVYLGSIALAQVVDLGTTLFIATDAINKVVKLASGVSSVFGVLVNGTTLTPQNVGHVVNIIAETIY